MYFKMALENIKRSFKEYWIYFITLTIGVCLFYSFNTLDSQEAMKHIKYIVGDGINMVPSLFSIIKMASIVVILALAFMVIYINSYLLKVRSKEFSTYMTLGMGRGEIAKILIIETTIVGVVSIILGCLIGIMVSQGINLIVVNAVQVGMDKYSFVISYRGILKTILGFGSIHIMVIIYNLFKVWRMNISKGLVKEYKQRDIGIRSLVIYSIGFLVSIALLGVAYSITITLTNNGHNVGVLFFNAIRMVVVEVRILLVIVCVLIGTVLFFYSLSRLICCLLGITKLNGIGIFTLSQISMRIVENTVTISIVCITIFLTITGLGFGLGFKSSIDAEFNNRYLYDISVELGDYRKKGDNPKAYIENMGYKFDSGENILFFSTYAVDNDKYISKRLAVKDVFPESVDHSAVVFIKLSDYNKIRVFNGREPITMDKDNIIIYPGDEDDKERFTRAKNSNRSIDILGKQFKIKKVINEGIGYKNDYFNEMYYPRIVIDDSHSNILTESFGYLNVNYPQGLSNKAYKLKSYAKKSYTENIEDGAHSVTCIIKESAYREQVFIELIFIYNAVFIGLIFLLASMTILSMHQIISVEEDINKYKTLKNIGADNRDINRSLFFQIGSYFIMPILLASSHSIVAIYALKVNFIANNKQIIMDSIPIVFLTILAVYGLYFIATYIGCKKIIKSNI